MQNNSMTIQDLNSDSNVDSFSDLVQNCVYGICINIKQHVLATNRELQILRRCSQMVSNNPERVVYVVTSEQKKKNFIVKTLLHHGVSCGQVRSELTTGSNTQAPEGIWLFVANA